MSLGTLSYRKWMNDTQTMRLRSREFKAIDDAIYAYEAPGGETPANRSAIAQALAAWKATKGAAWVRSDRNGKGAVTLLDNILSGKTPTKTAYLDSLQDGRLGLLYVFAGLSVDAKIFNIVLDVAMETGAAVLGFDPIKDVVGELPGSIMENSLVNKAGNWAIDKGREKFQARQGQSGQPKPPSRPPPPVPLTRMNAGLVSSTEIEKPGMLAQASEKLQQLMVKVRQALTEYATKAWRAMQKKFDAWLESPRDAIGENWGRIATVINFIVSKVAAQVAPIVGGALDIGKGLYDTICAIADRYESYVLSQKVEMNPGHPDAVAATITNILNFGIGKGLWDTLKGATQLGLDIGAAGAGAIFKLVVSCCEILAKFIYRLWDASRIQMFCEKCKTRYDSNKAAIESGKQGDLGSGPQFGEWLRNYFLTSPSLACIAILSGYAGDAMQWLDMSSTYNRMMSLSPEDWNKNSQALIAATAPDLQRGQKYLSHLKDVARDFMKDVGYNMKHSDASLNAILFKDPKKNPNFGYV